MSCGTCKTNFSTKNFGTDDLSKINLDGQDRTTLNWTEISVPEILPIPTQKPNIENIDQVYVTADVNCVKLIETPFSYKVYQRALLQGEIDDLLAAIGLATIDPALITAITTAVNAILNVPGLNTVPGIGPIIGAVQSALTGVTSASTALTTAIDNATDTLVLGVTANVALEAIEGVKDALTLLQNSLNSLVSAVQSLVDFVASIPIVGPAVAALLQPVLTAVQAVVDLVVDALAAILDAIAGLINTGISYFTITSNAEGTCLSGRKLVIEGFLRQKIVYTGLVTEQSVHSAHYTMPFSAFIIPYAKFDGLVYQENIQAVDENGNPVTINGFPFNPNDPITVDLCEDFSVTPYIEDIFAYALDERTVFKNVTLFLQAKLNRSC